MLGKPQWNQDLGKMRVAMGFRRGQFTHAYKDSLIVNWDNEDGSYITAIDKNTGKTLLERNARRANFLVHSARG